MCLSRGSRGDLAESRGDLAGISQGLLRKREQLHVAKLHRSAGRYGATPYGVQVCGAPTRRRPPRAMAEPLPTSARPPRAMAEPPSSLALCLPFAALCLPFAAPLAELPPGLSPAKNSPRPSNACRECMARLHGAIGCLEWMPRMHCR